jgi:parallel beta-helix repeat protein
MPRIDRLRSAISPLVCGVAVGFLGLGILIGVLIAGKGGGDEPQARDAGTKPGTQRASEHAKATVTLASRSAKVKANRATKPQPSIRVLPPSPVQSGAAPAGTTGTTGGVKCPTPTVRVETAEELRQALGAAAAGDSIGLADGVYEGNFVATGAGTEAAPIFLCGSSNAVLDGGDTSNGYVLHLENAQYWRVVGITVRNGQKGVMLDGSSNSILQRLTVEDIGDEGIHLRAASSDNQVLDNTVSRTGLRKQQFGEGIYIGSATSNWGRYSGGQPDQSDRNVISGNTTSQTGAESVDVKEGTTGGKLVSNTMDGTGMTGADSLVDVKGNDWVIQGNTARNGPVDGFQTHRILDGWGMRNVFKENNVAVIGGGYHVYINDPDDTGNNVSCDNVTADGAPLHTNVSCVP